MAGRERMTVLRITVCSVCEDINRPVKKYRVGTEEQLAKIPLCEQHSEPITRLLSTVSTRRRAAYKPTTMEEIQAKKQESDRPRRRSTKSAAASRRTG